jgi:hypothetical protein
MSWIVTQMEVNVDIPLISPISNHISMQRSFHLILVNSNMYVNESINRGNVHVIELSMPASPCI